MTQEAKSDASAKVQRMKAPKSNGDYVVVAAGSQRVALEKSYDENYNDVYVVHVGNSSQIKRQSGGYQITGKAKELGRFKYWSDAKGAAKSYIEGL